MSNGGAKYYRHGRALRGSARAAGVALTLLWASRSHAQPSATPPTVTDPTPQPVAAPATMAAPVTPTIEATSAGPPKDASPPSVASPPAAAVSFGSDPFAAISAATDLTLKLYGDTGLAVRDASGQPWTTYTSNANVYAPNVNFGFFATRLDLFGSASVDRLSFLTEIMFEGIKNGIGVDVERLQVSYLFGDWLRITAGRKHLSWGYYNDTYHHGNIFELTTGRPYSVDFEDSFGLVMAHLIGVAIDGTFRVGKTSIRYDAEVGNPRTADITAVPVQYAEDGQPTVNARLRWMPIDDLILGINGMRDVIPTLASGTAGIAARPETEELVFGAHAVYTEHHLLIDAEGFAMKHNPNGAESTSIYGAFAELGYTFGAFTPYVRPEFIRFPASRDLVFQYLAADPEGQIVGSSSPYTGVQNFFDLRVGVKWMALPQLALKLEGDRLGRDGLHQEVATVKVAFGF